MVKLSTCQMGRRFVQGTTTATQSNVQILAELSVWATAFMVMGLVVGAHRFTL